MSAIARALIVGAAPAPDAGGHYVRLVREAGFVIAADAGILVCLSAGRIPEVCVGDFDSTPPDALAEAARAGAEVHRFPVAKDVSDLDLAVSVARERGISEVRFASAFAGRLDHTLAALGTVMGAVDLGGLCEEPAWRGHPLRAGVSGDLVLAEPAGTIVSVIAVAGSARVSVEGMAYPLEEATLEPLSSLGLSNVAVGEVQRVRVSSGGVLVIVNRPT